MPTYRFCIGDTEGEQPRSMQLAGPDEAFAAAVLLATDLARDDPHVIWREQKLCVDLFDDQGRALLEVTIAATRPRSSHFGRRPVRRA